MRLLAVIALAAAALAVTATASTAGTARTSPQHRFSFVLHKAHAASRIAAAPWTNKAAPFKCVSACSAYESTINQYFTDVAAQSVLDNVSGTPTNVYSVATQYSSIKYDVTFGGSYVDGNPYPTTGACNDVIDKYCVTDAQLRTEIGKVIAKNHWPKQSYSTLYAIFTPANVGVCIKPGLADNSNPCTTNYFCAYHAAFGTRLKPVLPIYAVEPDAAAVPGDAIVPHPCGTGQAPAGNNADDTINTISHEQNEAITDPFGDGWWSEDSETYLGIPNAFFGAENGDLCAYNFGTPLGTTLAGQSYNQIINSHDYFLQQEYSNADGGCVQHLGGTATNFDPSNPLYEGVGPLVNHGGSVMTTNTVYAIYWVPTVPANTKLPVISGTAKVGQKLKASRGTWSNEPTYTYQWLRCSPGGKSCKNIAKTTHRSYTLVAVDKGHRIEVRVTATNMMGHRSAISAPTARVTK
jgi:hypothetical protein